MDPIFRTHALSKEGQDKVDIIRQRFDDLLEEIAGNIAGGGRYEALTKTRLEEACMMAVKAVATQPANQEHK